MDAGNELAGQTYFNTGGDKTAPTLTGTPYAGTTGTDACKVNAATAAPFSATDAILGYTDNCGGSVTATLTGTDVTGTDCSWTVTYTFKVADGCGNELAGQTYFNTGGDKTAPTLTGTPYAGTTGTDACKVNAATAAPFSATDAILGYTDNCGGTVTATLTGTDVTGTDCSWTVTYTFKVADGCGNELAGQTYFNTGGDKTAPTLTGTPYAGTTGTNACKVNAATAAPFSATDAILGYTDNCGGTVTATLTGTDVTGTDCSWTVTYTFKVADGCGNELAGQTYFNTGGDKTAPTLTGTPYAGTTGTNACKVNAATAAPFSATDAILGYTDNCGGTVTATLTGTDVTGTDCSWTVTYTFKVADGCGNELTGQTYFNTGGDKTAPTLTGTPYAGTTGTNACKVNAATAAPFSATDAILGYTDNCGGTVTATLTGTDVTGTDCSWTVTYTFKVADGCGNELAGQTYFNTGGDTTAPTLTGTPYAGTTGTNACKVNAATAAPFSATDAILGYTDNCGGTVTATLTGTDVTGTDCSWTVTYTFKVADGCGNELAGQTYFNTGGDKTAPTLTGTPYAGTTGTNACKVNAATAAPFSATDAILGYTDNCGGTVTATLTGTDVTGTDCSWTVTYTFKVADGCNNELTGQTYSNTGSDQTAPALTGTPYAGTTGTDACKANAATAAPFSAANAILGYTDNCGGSVTATLTGTDVTGTDCSWTVTYTFKVADGCGNELAGQTYFNTGGDTTPPDITCPTDVVLECPADTSVAANGSATASDNCDPDPEITHSDVSVAECGNTGTITRTWTATDECGNTDTCDQIITVVDTTDPEITCPGDITIECHEATDPTNTGQATATDNCDQSPTITYIDVVDMSGCGGYTGTITRTWTATDACTNTDSCVQTITVQDTTPPSINTPASDETVECDGAGNTAELNAWLASNGGASASDTCGGVTWSNDFTALSDLCGATGAATVKFTATDDCGKSASTTATFTIEDTTPPSINTPASDETVECDGAGNTAELNAWLASNGGASASDTCGGVTWSNDFTALSDLCGATGAATVKFTATDDCGKSASTTATFTIEDTTVPSIDVAASDETVECDGSGNTSELNAWLDDHGGAEASDVCCGTDVTWTHDFTGLSDDCGATGSATVTFTAEDCCGLTNTTSATFTIEDTTVPSIDVAASDETVECDGSGNTSELNAWLDDHGGAEASDVCCGTDVTWTHDFTGLSDDCGATGSATVTFTAEDCCGLTNTTSATFTIEDTTVPSIDVAASDETVECDGSGNTSELNAWLDDHGGAEASDVCCGTDVTWTHDFTRLSDDCGATGSATVTFTAEDCCGLTNTTSATFTIEDTTVPSIDVAASDETVECDGSGNTSELNAWLASNGGAAASDNCSDVTWSNDFTALSDLCGATGAATVKFTATDDCGNSSSTTATFTIEDTTPPSINTPASDETVECDGAGNTSELNAWLDDHGGAEASDVCCGTDVTWTHDFTALSDLCGATGAATATFTATDDCGNSSSTTATFTIEDTTPPDITCPPDVTTCSDVGVDYASGVSIGVATATDNCDSSPTVVGIRSDSLALDANYPVGTTTITWTATDACGNSATCVRTVVVRASPRASITPDPAQVYAKVDLQLHGNPTGGSGTYTSHTWTGVGAVHLSATNIENPIFTSDALGSYPLTYTIVDSNGCVGFDDIVVEVINATPVAGSPASLATCKNTPLMITLTATDPQIDPLDSTLHPITFGINSAPADGMISGNLTAVTYSAPHAASVTVVYTPDQDYVGDDSFSFIATDPFGAFAIATITITVEECEGVGGGGGAVFAEVVINEVAWAGTEASPQNEWIELLNNTDQLVDLTGWVLQWRRKQPATPEDEQWKRVTLSGTIAPNGYYVLEREHDETVSDVTANLVYDTTPPYSLELSDFGDVIELLDADGLVVDTANADHPERDGWIAGTGADGLPAFATMERIDPLSLDSDENWATNHHLIVNGLDATPQLLTATAGMINENTLLQTLAGGSPQVVQQGESVTIAVNFPLPAGGGGGLEGVPQVILAQMNQAAGGGGSVESTIQATAVSGKRVGGTYEVSLDTSELAPGTYGLWVNMGDGVFHGVLFEVVEG